MCNNILQCKLKSLEKRGIEPVAKILKENLTEDEAYDAERYYIALFKRKVEGGTLCNVMEGGNHPPSLTTIRETRSAEELEEIVRKQRASFKQTTTDRNKHKIERAIQLMNDGKMVKEIASELNVTATTVRAWLRSRNVSINYEGKRKAHIEKLKRTRHTHKVPKTAKTYTVLKPDNTTVVVQRLVAFCKENDIDYSGLRQTYKGKLKQYKGYVIIDVVEPVR